ncbi:histone acetyltransferases subunit 3-domain-containing protein [Radiomyces spectabilis]|uniref:histone acetyltransferases subunit 3-domain-containing protein n=1 Tax=Radiomyces spectabilis TaxID=64574 RepID=UPI00221FBECE|nr:histone acetyltransferases subunit 3-domain-containing protein [Radiomyces spectabilis]KAI8376236.1 histone acetyltransferases subunit 3-domain-containing protein [Radiomyces spectabilis]
MDTDLTRQYSSPTPVSASTAALYRQFKSSASSHVASQIGNIPESQELLSIKADLERLLPHSEARLRHLKKELNHLEKNVKIREANDTGTHKKQPSSGKNVNAMLEKMRIKQEASGLDDPSDLSPSSPSIPKSQMDRQAALETLRRRRRREDVDSTDDELKHSDSRRESPHHIVKIKKLEGVPSLTSRSMSPPSIPRSQSHSKHTPKSVDNTYLKKKKVSGSSSKMSSSAAAGRGHGINEGYPPSSQGKHNKPKPSNHATGSTKNSNDVDFVRVKAKDQIPILTFWTHLEPYFRPLSEEDREFLLEKPDNSKLFSIPALGRSYLETWAEEDRETGHQSRTHSPAGFRHGSHDSTLGGPSQERLKYLGPGDTLTDDYLLNDDLCCGTLTERLLSSLVPEEVDDALEVSMGMGADDDDRQSNLSDDEGRSDHYFEGRTIAEMSSEPPEDLLDFEERLKRELQYAGLFGEDGVDWSTREDDEICAELRFLQRELKEQGKVNEFRKKRLLDVVDRQLQYEQYRHVLDNLDAQVDQCYMKRFRIQKSKKRKSTSAPKTTLSENAIYAMEKRKTWINALEGIFKDKNLVMPTRSIYETDGEEEDPSPSEGHTRS